MASSNENVSMALFCDFENVALGVRDAKYDKFDIKLVLERLLLKGSIVVKKAYCDWDRYKSFKGAMHEANFELIEIPHVRQSGKNSADIRLVVDALDLCYTKSHVNTFVIISGDSDFSPLVSKLRENAKQVIGVGVQQSTSDLLIANCDEFFFYDDLVRESQRSVARRESSRPQQSAQQTAKRAPDEDKARPKEDLEKRRSKAVEIAVQTFDALASERGDSGKIWASVLKNAIKRRKPDFNETYYGFRAFGNLLEEAQARGLLEFGRDEKSGAYVYRSAAATVAGETVSEAVEAEPAEHSYKAQTAETNTGEPGGKHESRRKDRNKRKAGRGQQEVVSEESAAVGPAVTELVILTEPQEDKTHEQLPSANEFVAIAAMQPETPSVASEHASTESVTGGESTQEDEGDQPERPQNAKKRASRKTTAKKVKKSTPRPIDEVPEIAAPTETSASPGSEGEAPVAARKTARKTTARGRRPRKATTADKPESTE
ncbi:NYN domain-containing protein [Paraburkholderia sp. Ac-20342]|uniref:NYN domain-containing protein n=1 Tax=unclassified Paraburkholderia TaxID=2615204 RepID=UPI00141D9C88|nr:MULTISPECIES: NYN domain-containing protein [unclassified Paraburkholderia]MBN3850345.1 NYN domain-containing protein [Paraburkholderia sp. Ac-20342]NIF76229.1 NYN domain-containing protein [Paraburkholderia sp. Cy-641]